MGDDVSTTRGSGWVLTTDSMHGPTRYRGCLHYPAAMDFRQVSEVFDGYWLS